MPPSVAPPTLQGAAGEYTSLVPQRVLDTRTAVGVPAGRVGARTTIHLGVAARTGVPLGGVAAVVLNVTAIDATAATFVTVYPHDGERPEISSLNLRPGSTVANLVTVPVSDDGSISFYNDAGSIDLVADIAGYYATSRGPSGSRFTALTPARLADTRTTSTPLGRRGGRSTLAVQVSGRLGVPARGASAVVLNVTAIAATTAGYLTVWPTDTPRPNASNLNFAAGATRANQAIVKLSPSGTINVAADADAVDVVVDVVGYYSTSALGSGGRFLALAPFRAIDTRVASPFPGDGTMWDQDVLYAGRELAPNEPAAAYVLNVTVVGPDSPGYVTVFPYPAAPPNASSINFAAGDTVANHVIVATGPQVGVLNVGGGSHVIVDVFGAFTK